MQPLRDILFNKNSFYSESETQFEPQHDLINENIRYSRNIRVENNY